MIATKDRKIYYEIIRSKLIRIESYWVAIKADMDFIQERLIELEKDEV